MFLWKIIEVFISSPVKRILNFKRSKYNEKAPFGALIGMNYGGGCLIRKALISHARGCHRADIPELYK
jgi:hypothetical protein